MFQTKKTPRKERFLCLYQDYLFFFFVVFFLAALFTVFFFALFFAFFFGMRKIY